MLKTQLAAAPLPLGCDWPAPSRHPLEARVLSAAAGVGAWAAQPLSPPHVRWLDMPNPVAERRARATVVVISMTTDQVTALTLAAK